MVRKEGAQSNVTFLVCPSAEQVDLVVNNPKEDIPYDEYLPKVVPASFKREGYCCDDHLKENETLLDTFFNVSVQGLRTASLEMVSQLVGLIWVTNLRVIFAPYSLSSRPEPDKPHFFVCPLKAIAQMDAVPSLHNNILLFSFKTPMPPLRVTLAGNPDPAVARSSLQALLEKYVHGSVANLFAFVVSSDTKTPIFKWEDEWIRQGLSNKHWKVLRNSFPHSERRYELCTSYPVEFVVPVKYTRSVREAMRYRSSNRFPILCWQHPINTAAIVRCSQPLVGTMGSNKLRDVQVMNAIHDINKHVANVSLIFFDCRSKVAALANVARGGGYEDPSDYNNADIQFLDIANIHHVRDAYDSLRAWCEGYSRERIELKKTSVVVETQSWYYHLSSILKGTVQVLKAVKSGVTAVVHCSDGWDRTSQIVSLVQLLLDAHYRTLRGFALLVEKEWVTTGHQFAKRGGQSLDDSQRAPIFLQFLECVWQIQRQYPTAFEFDERLLLFLAEHTHSGQYSTFLFDNEAQREQCPVRGVSIWSDVTRSDRFVNEKCQKFPWMEDFKLKVDQRDLHFWWLHFMQPSFVTL